MSTTPYHSKALPQGTVLREWRLEHVLGVGGFGIVYRGKGVYFDELVAIKEYFPGAISDRQDGTTVTPSDSSSEEVYHLGLQKFVEEAKVLWNLSKPDRHPNIVSVRALFEIHGTAYMVMDFEQGVSLSQLLRDGHTFDEAGLLKLIKPIAEGLDRAHRAGVLHRDIKPANILVDEAGRPVLIDFGSARFDSGQATSTKVTFYTPPYAALEQYVKTYPQGPWTDIYALGVTLYQCVTGEKPPEVLERMHGGLGEALSAQSRPGFSRPFTRAIDAAMAIRPTDRPQSIPEWLKLFDAPDEPDAAEEDEATRIRMPMAAPPAAAAQTPAPPKIEPAPVAAKPKTAKTAPAAAPVVAPEPESSEEIRRKPPWAILSVGAAAVLAVGAGALLLAPHPAVKPAPAPAPTAATPPPAAKTTGSSIAASLSAVQAIGQDADGLIGDAQQLGRPSSEMNVLNASKAKLADLAGQMKALAPGAAAKAPPLMDAINTEAESMAHAETAALGRVAEGQWREVDRTLNHASVAGAASADSKLRQARTSLSTAIAAVPQADGGAGAITAARTALTSFGAFSDAYGAASPLLAPAKRTGLAAVQTAARQITGQIATLASGSKPWLFASKTRKQAYQTMQDNAARSKTEMAQLDTLVQSMAATTDLRQLDGAVTQAGGIKRDLAALYESSRAASAPEATAATAK